MGNDWGLVRKREGRGGGTSRCAEQVDMHWERCVDYGGRILRTGGVKVCAVGYSRSWRGIYIVCVYVSPACPCPAERCHDRKFFRGTARRPRCVSVTQPP